MTRRAEQHKGDRHAAVSLGAEWLESHVTPVFIRSWRKKYHIEVRFTEPKIQRDYEWTGPPQAVLYTTGLMRDSRGQLSQLKVVWNRRKINTGSQWRYKWTIDICSLQHWLCWRTGIWELPKETAR